MQKIFKPKRTKMMTISEIKFKIPKFNLFGVMDSISDYELFRFWIIILGITGWILFFIEYCS
jgi:hypothetical protein